VWGRILHVTAGIFALLSAASITTVLTELTNSLTVKITSVGLSFVSGIITLLMSSLFNDKETRHLFEGAAKFMILRNQARLIIQRPDLTEAKAYAELMKLDYEYQRESTEFDRFIPEKTPYMVYPLTSREPTKTHAV